jgi:UDP-2,3-diacylglucosamine hydrolase
MAEGPAVERSLGVMCGAGELPALMVEQARRHGWRVVVFAFAPASPRVLADAARVVPSRISEIGPVMGALLEEKVTGVLLSGKFWMGDLLRVEDVDDTHRAMAARAGSLLDGNVKSVLLETLAGMGVELLDQRPFLGDGLPTEQVLGARTPSAEEWADVRRGLEVAGVAAAMSIGQTVVVRRGAVSAVEAIEGTTVAVRRGTALSGPGAVVVKAVAPDHDFRFDVPTIGPDTVEAAAEGGATVVALEAGRVFVLDRDTTTRRADAAGIALVSTRAPGR